jgi:hypothetical protein
VSHGYLVKSYILYCATCDELICFEGIPEMSVTVRDCAGLARGEGWVLTKERGWTCPNCIEATDNKETAL